MSLNQMMESSYLEIALSWVRAHLVKSITPSGPVGYFGAVVIGALSVLIIGTQLVVLLAKRRPA